LTESPLPQTMTPILSPMLVPMRCAVPEPEASTVDPALLGALAALVGVDLSAAQAATLAVQAEPHFAQLRALDAAADPGAEPAAAFRLDDWPAGDDG